MGFVQTIEMKTSRFDEIERVQEEWRAATEGRRSATRSLVTQDRDRPDTFVVVVEFPSYEDAMRNSALPETAEFAEKITKLCDEPPVFRNLDVRISWEL